jgi:hypothetical protein
MGGSGSAGLAYAVLSSPYNFDIYHNQDGSRIPTTRYGWRTELDVGGTKTTIVGLQPTTSNGVTVGTIITQVQNDWMRLMFTVTNAGDVQQTIGVAVGGDAYLNGDNNAYLWRRTPGLGMRDQLAVVGIYDWSFSVSWEIDSCPRLTPVNAYWFGDPGSLPGALWSSATSGSMTGGDSAFAFSWQNRAYATRPYFGFHSTARALLLQ